MEREDGNRRFAESYTCAELERFGCASGGFWKGSARNVQIFRIPVPAFGCYRVEAEVCAREDGEILLFGNRRRLFAKRVLRAGECFTKAFLILLTESPVSEKELGEEPAVFVSLAGPAELSGASVRAVYEDERVPIVFAAGDSTMTDQEADLANLSSGLYHTAGVYCGWGEMFSCFFSEAAVFSNHARSGRTTLSFREEGHYAIVRQYLKPGDFFLIQFGHNDQKLAELDSFGGYRRELERYAREIQEAGAFPILATPVGRNIWKQDGTYADLLWHHADAVRDLGEKMDLPVLDLHRITTERIRREGEAKTSLYLYPGDRTHANDYGGYRIASEAASALKALLEKRSEEAYRRLAACICPPVSEEAWEPDPSREQELIRKSKELAGDGSDFQKALERGDGELYAFLTR